MSIMNQDGDKVILPRRDADEFWSRIEQHYVSRKDHAWRDLAALALREHAGWSLERIGQALGVDRGHVHRILRNLKSEMQTIFQQPPDWDCQSPDKEHES